MARQRLVEAASTHLAEHDHDRVANRAHDGVAEPETERATMAERVGRAEEETSADDTLRGETGSARRERTPIEIIWM